ncbi:MAG: 1-acyl-sn-glycerol-3-phosphate acyltransferase [Anaerolineales bacterium]|nr:1-acyl-sn-glycerol-3-phosphate acyltransferase [Anaerolineales bacterium]
MSTPPAPKPVSKVWRPELTRLPELTLGRRLLRGLLRLLCRLTILVCTRPTVRGLEHYPRRGPALVVINHLGDPDAVLVVASLPKTPDGIAKIELRSIPVLGVVMQAFGVIWVHRGQADRRALVEALRGLRQGRQVLIAPEGRESLTGALEQGTEGAAYLAIKTGVPVVPVALTGTETGLVYASLRKWRRRPVTLTVGEPFTLPPSRDRQAVEAGTRRIMETLARLLPPAYRGVYSDREVDDA